MIPVVGPTEVLGSWVMPSAIRRILMQPHAVVKFHEAKLLLLLPPIGA